MLAVGVLGATQRIFERMRIWDKCITCSSAFATYVSYASYISMLSLRLPHTATASAAAVCHHRARTELHRWRLKTRHKWLDTCLSPRTKSYVLSSASSSSLDSPCQTIDISAASSCLCRTYLCLLVRHTRLQQYDSLHTCAARKAARSLAVLWLFELHVQLIQQRQLHRLR